MATAEGHLWVPDGAFHEQTPGPQQEAGFAVSRPCLAKRGLQCRACSLLLEEPIPEQPVHAATP